MLSTREPQVGGGPAGGAGQIHANPKSELGAAEHTHTMSGLEIGLMVGIILVFANIIGSLLWYRARKLKRMQADREAGDRPGAQDGDAEAYDEVKKPAQVLSGSFRQPFGRKWLGPKGGKFSSDAVTSYAAVANSDSW